MILECAFGSGRVFTRELLELTRHTRAREFSMDAALDAALRDAKRAFGGGRAGAGGWREAVDAWMGFYHAVDWSEGWLKLLLCAHVCLFIAIASTRGSDRAQGGLFCICVVVVLAAERINALGDTHWETFASQNYFDKRGRFISIVLSTPLVVATLLILVNLLFIMTGMMVEVARKRRKTGVKKTQ